MSADERRSIGFADRARAGCVFEVTNTGDSQIVETLRSVLAGGGSVLAERGAGLGPGGGRDGEAGESGDWPETAVRIAPFLSWVGGGFRRGGYVVVQDAPERPDWQPQIGR